MDDIYGWNVYEKCLTGSLLQRKIFLNWFCSLKRNPIYLLALVIGLFLLNEASLSFQDSTRSLALRDVTPERSPFHLSPNQSDEALWDEFLLMKKANASDPVAQHELGLRYLSAKDFVADTQKAAYWIGKASAQHLAPAQYNYGILLNNGWGVPWDPFAAYKCFQSAASRCIVEGEYVYGLLMTDNLIVPRNYSEAYHWISMAADSGFVPAKDVLVEFEKRGIMAKIREEAKTAQHAKESHQAISKRANSTLRPVYIDFSSDSIHQPDDGKLLKEATDEVESVQLRALKRANTASSDTIKLLLDAAEAGSPEALTMIGRFSEKGNAMKKDLVRAAFYYLRALRMDAPWSPMLLWNMTRDAAFYDLLKEQVDRDGPTAEFVWAGLIEFGFDNRLTEGQALALLEKASHQELPEAIVQLAMCYYTGHWVKKDREKSIELFENAARLGNREATIRLCSIRLESLTPKKQSAELIQTLRNSANEGSSLAEALLGYCYWEGKGIIADTAEAVRLFRNAAQRGSQVAYHALRKMYDDMRPDDPEFQIAE